jgi:hypothetical protein
MIGADGKEIGYYLVVKDLVGYNFVQIDNQDDPSKNSVTFTKTRFIRAAGQDLFQSLQTHLLTSDGSIRRDDLPPYYWTGRIRREGEQVEIAFPSSRVSETLTGPNIRDAGQFTREFLARAREAGFFSEVYKLRELGSDDAARQRQRIRDFLARADQDVIARIQSEMASESMTAVRRAPDEPPQEEAKQAGDSNAADDVIELLKELERGGQAGNSTSGIETDPFSDRSTAWTRIRAASGAQAQLQLQCGGENPTTRLILSFPRRVADYLPNNTTWDVAAVDVRFNQDAPGQLGFIIGTSGRDLFTPNDTPLRSFLTLETRLSGVPTGGGLRDHFTFDYNIEGLVNTVAAARTVMFRAYSTDGTEMTATFDLTGSATAIQQVRRHCQ